MIAILSSGSLWEPRINGISLPDDSVLVSFNPAVEAISYFIQVISFQEDGNECKRTTKQISEVISSLFCLPLEAYQKADSCPESLNSTSGISMSLLISLESVFHHFSSHQNSQLSIHSCSTIK